MLSVIWISTALVVSLAAGIITEFVAPKNKIISTAAALIVMAAVLFYVSGDTFDIALSAITIVLVNFAFTDFFANSKKYLQKLMK